MYGNIFIINIFELKWCSRRQWPRDPTASVSIVQLRAKNSIFIWNGKSQMADKEIELIESSFDNLP